MMRRPDPWLISLAACCVAAGVWAGFAPLADPDLPMHLAVGEWIFAHHRVPFEEPFAWTRAGDPYYAYSWLAQSTFFATMKTFGPAGLHVLAGVVAIVIILAGALVGRVMGLGAARSTILGAISMAIAMESTPFLRPQLFMFALVPLAWAAAYQFERAQGRSRVLHGFALWGISALAAAIHITFPVVAAPLIVLWARANAKDIPRLLTASGVIAMGWLTSPYAMHWPAVFALNLGYDAVLAGPSPPGELAPGFSVSPIVGVALASLPFIADVRSTGRGERFALSLLWLAGLLVFGRFFKGLGPWWWCALPLSVMALRELPEPSGRRVELSWAALVASILFAFTPTNIRLWLATRGYEGGIDSRSLPSLKAFAAEPAARWLESHARVSPGTRLLTTTNYGSYLKWRLPAVSESIDSRSIFPDSVALPDVPSTRAVRVVGPWRESDLAIVPETYPVASILDRDLSWTRVGTAVTSPWAPSAPRAGLWARRAWLAAHARAALPHSPLTLELSGPTPAK